MSSTGTPRTGPQGSIFPTAAIPSVRNSYAVTCKRRVLLITPFHDSLFTPDLLRGQIKIAQDVKDYLEEAEEAATEMKRQRDSKLWDEKMRATQTESACAVRGL